ncbi:MULTISPECIES: endonuclease/exonuclease/phosphatase family protein [unclassified Halomonas]|uniref:endonuclease/exonuclease/phosphatase family protein n=1 Tax=unclassified Halomonas TaxID=2609666 RepID=UPI0028856E81|nr:MULTISPECIES: endonuclease/exonuclease/phosphatase family protein [unclassified Halomonas]MDT0501244.1 endonuclease/exonuclease/phosphatase family protein [Halomonas sp. PAR7]MDT0511377.1 endonuclease/exonuclease/phosphatase family protein [Halomonas sp. LES1]MDT0590335.1 endonuclease/exonuclease/phosphatase family protein [Halomonas sp. PAR8]
MISILYTALALLLLVITLAARLRVTWWWIRIAEFPRVQLASAALLLLPIGAFADSPWSWVGLGASLLVVAIQLAYVLPWTPLWPVQVKAAEPGNDDRCLTLLIANVLTPNRNAQGLITQIHDHRPDIVLTLESDGWWQEQLDDALNQEWPHAVRIPLDNLYGMHLYSRLPLISPRVEWLIQDDIPSILTGVRLRCGDEIRFHALHPRPPAPGESKESLWRDAELMLVGRAIHADPVPTLVAGDLNDVAWSRTTRLFCRVSGMLDPRRGRGMFSTFHARYPLLRWPLDHVFTSEHFTLRELKRLDGFGSDHFPILSTLCFRPVRADEHDTPEAEQAEHRKARKTAREGKVQEQQE